MEYVVGQGVRSSVSFRAIVTGTLTDPTAVTFKKRAPDGTETTHVYGSDVNVIKDGTGRYHYDFIVTASGNWHTRWKGEGVLDAASEEVVTVEASAFTSP